MSSVPKNLEHGFKANNWTVLGAFGRGLYKVQHQKSQKIGAMKLEKEGCNMLKEIKLFVALNKHTLGAKNVAEMMAYEQLEGNLKPQFLVMELFGSDIRELRKKCGGKLSVSTVLRIGVQTLCGIKSIHDVGFVHRNLSPSCFVLGNPDIPQKCRQILIGNFEYARRFFKRAKDNIGIYREERDPGAFRMIGFFRYVSVSVSNGNEARCCDDLWSWIYILAELINDLPWQNLSLSPSKIQTLKMSTSDKELFSAVIQKDLQDCLIKICQYLRTLHADSKPDYLGIYCQLKKAMTICGVKFTDPYDWECTVTKDCVFLTDVELEQYFKHDEFRVFRENKLKGVSPSSPEQFQKNQIRPSPDNKEIPSPFKEDVTQQSPVLADQKLVNEKRVSKEKDQGSNKKKKKVKTEKKGKSQPAPDSKESDAKKAALAAAAEKAKSAPLKCPPIDSDKRREKKEREDKQITGEQSAKNPRAILKKKKAVKGGGETKEKAGSNLKK